MTSSSVYGNYKLTVDKAFTAANVAEIIDFDLIEKQSGFTYLGGGIFRTDIAGDYTIRLETQVSRTGPANRWR